MDDRIADEIEEETDVGFAVETDVDVGDETDEAAVAGDTGIVHVDIAAIESGFWLVTVPFSIQVPSMLLQHVVLRYPQQ